MTEKSVKVEFKEKKSFNYFSIVKWILGLYLIGVMMTLNSYALSYTAQFLYSKVMPSSFMTAELTKFAELLREPLFPLIISIPFFVPAVIMLFIINFTLNKTNIFPGTQKKIYMTIATVLILLISVSAFLFA